VVVVASCTQRYLNYRVDLHVLVVIRLLKMIFMNNILSNNSKFTFFAPIFSQIAKILAGLSSKFSNLVGLCKFRPSNFDRNRCFSP
jgi:hypothetical protein